MRALVSSFFALFLATPVLAGDAPGPGAPAPTWTASKPVSGSLPQATPSGPATMIALPAQPASFSVEMHPVGNGEDMTMKRTVDGAKTRMDIAGKKAAGLVTH